MSATSRESWGSKIGFVLAAAGSAVGLGNIWKFPYVTGNNGGAAFVLIYLVCVLILGLPIMVAELVIGRHTKKDPVGAFKAMAKGTHWELVGYMGVLSGFFIMTFYSVVGGWTLGYIVKSIDGTIMGITGVEGAQSVFGQFVGSPLSQIFFHGLFMLFSLFIVIRGVRNGIEKWSKMLMPFLLLLLVVLIIRGITMPGAMKGVMFLLQPDFSRLTFRAVMSALGHSFFTLSLGMGAMITYGSYIQENEPVLNSAFWIVALDTGIAILAGLAIFPAVFAMGMEPSQGAGLIFNIIPAIFAKMGFGVVFSVIFFLLLFIASLTSAISLVEVVTAYFIDELNIPRKKSALIVSGIIFVLGIPAALSFNLMSETTIFFGMNYFDFMDNLTTNYMLPIGGFLIAVFLGWKYGISKTEHELDPDTSMTCIKHAWGITLRYISPVVLLFFFIYYLSNLPGFTFTLETIPRAAIILMVIYYLVIAANTRSRNGNSN